ncbi:AAA family ATPase [bacterium]|nr:AAA family ATPase [bacterium]
MKRDALQYLTEWADAPRRKPLVVRGARQVGKTHLIRQFAGHHFDDLVELNLERDADLIAMFDDLAPARIVPLLELRLDREIRPGRTLLFLDEIQAAPRALQSLRYFHEEMPALHVVAAGSLLDFALDGDDGSVPVGRLEYLHLGPMTFVEFLAGLGQTKLAGFVRTFELGDPRIDALHHHLLSWLRIHGAVGGMPEAVRTYRDTESFLRVDQVKEGLLATFRDDFGKYRGRLDDGLIRLVFDRLPHLVGGKLKYARVDRDIKAARIAAALDLLCRAGFVSRIHHSAGNGVPLGAEINPRVFKPLLLDVGLLMRACGLDMSDVADADSLMTVNSGAVAEQIVGQELRAAQPFWQEPALHYWVREKTSSSAEVDYLLACGQEIVPLEVKAGETGHLRSLHQFLHDKHRGFGIRMGTSPPQLADIDLKLPTSERVVGRLLSLPLYLAGEAERLAASVVGASS